MISITRHVFILGQGRVSMILYPVADSALVGFVMRFSLTVRL
jgi:hypothetical protein